MRPQEFVDTVSTLSFKNVFNPYSDRCPVHDRPAAACIRRSALLATLNAAVQTEIDSLWIGRDLGYRGGRRTGLALTDDMHLESYATRWGIVIDRPTKGPAVAERTAAAIWRLLGGIGVAVALWNVFPLHPHDEGNPFSNRVHNSQERQSGEELLGALISLLKPRRLVALGNEAAEVVARLAKDQAIVKLRHPSYGGQTEFEQQVRALYGAPNESRQRHLI